MYVCACVSIYVWMYVQVYTCICVSECGVYVIDKLWLQDIHEAVIELEAEA